MPPAAMRSSSSYFPNLVVSGDNVVARLGPRNLPRSGARSPCLLQRVGAMVRAVRSSPLWLLLTSFVAAAEPAVLLFPAVGTPASVTLSGRVLKHAPSRGSSTFSKNLRRLTSSNWVGAAVEVRFAGRAAETTTGPGGNFSVTFRAEGKPFAAQYLYPIRVD